MNITKLGELTLLWKCVPWVEKAIVLISFFSLVFKTTKYVSWHWLVANDRSPSQKTVSLCFSHCRHKPAALALTTSTFHVAFSLLSLSLSLYPHSLYFLSIRSCNNEIGVLKTWAQSIVCATGHAILASIALTLQILCWHLRGQEKVGINALFYIWDWANNVGSPNNYS